MEYDAAYFGRQIPNYTATRFQEVPTFFAMKTQSNIFFDVLLTVHLSIFILVINQLDAQNFVLQ